MQKDLPDFITDPGDILFWAWWIFWPVTIPATIIWWIVEEVF